MNDIFIYSLNEKTVIGNILELNLRKKQNITESTIVNLFLILAKRLARKNNANKRTCGVFINGIDPMTMR